MADEFSELKQNPDVSRRTFLGATLASGAALLSGGCVRPGASTAGEEPAMNPIGVYNEWGRLREVIVGVLPDDALVPTPTHFCYEYMGKATLELLQTRQGQSLKEVAPDVFEGTLRQLDGLVKAYEQAGVKVHRARPWTTEEQHFLDHLAVGGFP